MKYRMRKTSLLVSLIFLLAVLPFHSATAAYQVAENVRVGLYFTDPSSHINTSVASFTVNAPAGLQAGFYNSGTFTELYPVPDATAITIRKDTYFNYSAGVIKEFAPASGTVPAGEKSGPYHVKIGADLADLASANAMVTTLRDSGIQAFPVYTGTWQVWSGAYMDAVQAQQAIDSILKPVLGGDTLVIMEPDNSRIAVVSADNRILALFGGSSAYFQVRPRQENNPYIFNINNKPYRGFLEVRRITGSDMTVINELPINQYLYGNVPPEIGASSHAEALKAQALASKMYAVNSARKHGKYGFDVCSTTNCQVYKGYSVEKQACNDAIDQVRDKVITYNGSLARQIYYFASSAGRTEDSKNVWGYSHPYLKSVEDKYEPIYKWTKTMRSSDIRAKVPGVGNIAGIDITKMSESGRAIEMVVRGDRDRARYTLEKCRTLFSLSSQLYTITTDADIFVAGSDGSSRKTQLGGQFAVVSDGTVKQLKSPSNKVAVLGADGKARTVALTPETFIFSGKGWGHAVGMSQEGARGMAKAGFTYDQILQHYFTGTSIE